MKQLIIILLLSISFQGLSQQPVFVCDGSGGLYSLNLNDCTSRLVGKTQQVFIDIAFTPDGRLWGVDGDALYKIDTTNLTTTFIGFGGGGGTYSASLVALNDSILLGEYNDTLYGISVSTAQNYKIGIIGYEAYGDLTWLGNNLYMNADNGQLIKIVLNNTYNEILSSTPVNNINDPLPAMYGLATVSLNGSDSIIGFGGRDNIDRISQVNGTYQPICESINPIGSFGAASLSYPNALPVNLLNFSYVLINQSIQLQWKTTSEINSSYFSIERSTDGINFITIGKQAAAGNSNIIKQYAFIDNNPSANNYYRLQEIDKDGKLTYTNILFAKLLQIQPLTVLDNPVQNNLHIQVNISPYQTNKLSIFDFTGRKLKTLTVQNGNQNIEVSSLSSGVYILQLITADGEIFNKQFIKN